MNPGHPKYEAGVLTTDREVGNKLETDN